MSVSVMVYASRRVCQGVCEIVYQDDFVICVSDSVIVCMSLSLCVRICVG